jgi:CheY-like chemotaxis protein
MRVLLVEDKVDFAATVEQAVRSIPNCELVWVASRDAALARLATESFDLVVLDRRIPSGDGVLDDHHDHGWRVFIFIREELPGTSVWFLTGTEDADFAMEINNNHGKIEDIHGRRVKEQMYQVCWKKHITVCVRSIREFAEHRSALDRIAIRPQPANLAVSDAERRTLRIFGRRRDGTAI